MHGDDVASAGVSLTTEIISKANDIILEFLKVSIDKERQYVQNKTAKKNSDLPGGEVSYKKLKEGGEINVVPGYSKEDFKELAKRAKKLGIPVTGVQEKSKENTISLFFNTKDKTALDEIITDIHEMKKESPPEQREKMIPLDKSNVESFQMYCADHDIPVNFMESQDGVKCIFPAAYENQVQQAVVNHRIMQGELSKMSVEIVKENGKPKIVLTDLNEGKKLTMNFCTKARFERMLTERMGFEPFKAAQVANVFADKLTEEQKRFYYSGSRTVEQMDYFEKDIKLDDDNILTEKFSFAKMKFKNEKEPHLTITDSEGRFVVLSGASIRREEVEQNIRNYLQVKDSETITALMNKAEKLGFAEKAVTLNFKKFTIERESQNSFTVMPRPP